MRTQALVVVVVAGLGILAGGGGDVRAERPASAAVQGGRNLAWCIRGIRWLSQGLASDNDLLEFGGGVIAYLNCR
jgi:hypothetical protein